MKQKIILGVATLFLFMSPNLLAQTSFEWSQKDLQEKTEELGWSQKDLQESIQKMKEQRAEWRGKREEWKEKVRAEKQAFLEKYLNLTTKEAKEFWPIYKELEKKKDQATIKKIRAYRALSQALKDKKPEKEIEKLLDSYLKAQSELRDVEESYSKKLKKVLSSEKLAKFYVSEEKFRHIQIKRLGKQNFHHPHQNPQSQAR